MIVVAYLTTQAGQPALILREGTARRRGRQAQRNNIMAARIIAEVLRTTLGPRGMDKMLIDSLGDITITNDGAAILDEIDVNHPAAKMMVEVAKTQDDMVGDGTTMYKNGVIEPVRVKEQAIKSAAEVASMILRIDDVIAATKPKEKPAGLGEEEF